jgi:hypothetical protein
MIHPMKKLMLLTAFALVAVPVALAAKPTTPGSNGSGGKALVAKLTGANAQAHVGDHGNVVVRLNAKTLKICWSYSNLKLTPLGATSATPNASHIHTGAAGVSGGVLVPFGATSFERKGCTTTSKATIDAILANPAGYYVNVHNPSYPGGAIRGQLKKGAPA